LSFSIKRSLPSMRKLLNERSGKRRSVFKDEPRPAETHLRDRRRGLMAVGPIRDLRLLTGVCRQSVALTPESGTRRGHRGRVHGMSERGDNNQRGQRESSDKCLHDASPCLDRRPRFVHQRRGRSAGACSRPLPADLFGLAHIRCDISGIARLVRSRPARKPAAFKVR
jgi:hypothetical protein